MRYTGASSILQAPQRPRAAAWPGGGGGGRSGGRSGGGGGGGGGGGSPLPRGGRRRRTGGRARCQCCRPAGVNGPSEERRSVSASSRR
jgi:hypothetical protein